MTEPALPIRRDHVLARKLADPFALYEPCDCLCGGNPTETGIRHDAWCPGPNTVEDPTTNTKGTTRK